MRTRLTPWGRALMKGYRMAAASAADYLETARTWPHSRQADKYIQDAQRCHNRAMQYKSDARKEIVCL